MSNLNDLITFNLLSLPPKKEELSSYISNFDFTPQMFHHVFECALERQSFETLKALFEVESFRIHYTFLGSLLDEFLNQKRFHLLDFPFSLKAPYDFDSLLFQIIKKDKSHPYKKHLGLLLHRYGTRSANNLIILSHFTRGLLNTDKAMNLKHKKKISSECFLSLSKEETPLLRMISESSPPARRFKILISFKTSTHIDIIKMITLLSKYYPLNELLALFKSPPHSFSDIHETLLSLIMALDQHSNDAPLNQRLQFLDGKQILEYRVSVPKQRSDLLLTGKIMHHCVGSYIVDVEKNISNIINLLKNDEIIFTVELIFSSGSWHINQMKGKYNSSEFEGPLGGPLRKALLSYINGHTF